MASQWYERINRLDDLEVYFEEFLDTDTLKNIQYISIRKKKNWYLLVGVNDLEVEAKILSYKPRILKNISKYMETKKNEYEKKMFPKSMTIFKYDLEAAKEKKELKKKWDKDPFSFFKHTSLDNIMYKENNNYFIIRKNYIIPLDNNTYISNREAEMIVYNNKYDFIAEDRYKKIWKYIKNDNKYYKYANTLNQNSFSIHKTERIGIGTLYCDVNFSSYFREVKKDTYNKWKNNKL